MKAPIQLKPNEILIFSEEAYLNVESNKGLLYVTNEELLWEEKQSFFKKQKEAIRIPFESIKVNNGIIQHEFNFYEIHEEGVIGTFLLYTNDGKTYRFGVECDINAFIDLMNSINYGATGITHVFKKDIKTEGGLLKKQIVSIVINESIVENIGQYQRIISKCDGCGAQLIGYKNQEITCDFCQKKKIL